jgi:hypothetical protein
MPSVNVRSSLALYSLLDLVTPATSLSAIVRNVAFRSFVGTRVDLDNLALTFVAGVVLALPDQFIGRDGSWIGAGL